jgi:hypothetical protein
MVSHRRAGVLARALRLRRSPDEAPPVPGRVGIEFVDTRTRLRHRVSPDELVTGRVRGDYQTFCGLRVLAASLTEPGYGWCAECGRG